MTWITREVVNYMINLRTAWKFSNLRINRKGQFFRKGRVGGCAIFASQRSSLGKRGGDNRRSRGDYWRWQITSFATCAQRHFQIEVTFTVTRKPTLGLNSFAHSVTSHLVKMPVWRLTPSFTPGRNRTHAHTATFHATSLPTSQGISRSTPGNNCTNVTNVN